MFTLQCVSNNTHGPARKQLQLHLTHLQFAGVSCGGFSVNMPENITALSGSCVAIKCDFNIEDKYDKYLTEDDATGVWLKDGMDANINQVFNSRVSKSNRFSGKTTGKLHEKNCTTIFYNVSSNHNGKYYFRITSGEDLKCTYPQPFSTVNVIEFPPKPTVQLYVEQKEVQDQEEVLERSSVSLRCSAETLCSSPPPTLTWSSTPRIPFSESSRLQELILISDLNFTATHRQHRVTFTCTITYQLQDKNKTAQNSITLHVQYAPNNTSVSVLPSSSVLEGSSVTLTCSSDANPAVNYTWFKESGGQLEQLQTGDTVTFNRTDLKHRGWYHCTAQNQHGSQNSSVMLDIQYAPKISPSPSCYKTVCFCEADGNPSPKLEWHLSGRPVTNSSNTFISEERLSSTGLRSSITLHQSLTNTSTLQCVSNNTHGTARKQLQLPLSHLQIADCQQATVLLLIILPLVLALYTLTVGLGLYKIRQLSTKLKTQNEAAGTYASLQLSSPLSEYETLNIKRGGTQ
ncbi:sialic acid-binding Ig-like lectin 14 [Garra rufa]|uniref:sialic acid-binding Ig-like lectin 14 n=1 Tax=Garra rufa TaxID=137080 RepID=UPI003CCE9135